jgi:hypothetical protein
MQLVAKVSTDVGGHIVEWISLSGGSGFGFLLRTHQSADSPEPYDQWQPTLERAMAWGEPYGASRADWFRPDPAWVNAPSPVGFVEAPDSN